MKRRVGLSGGWLVLMATALLSSPAASFGAVDCTYSGADRLLTVTASDSSTTITRSADEIVVSSSQGPISCGGGPPTVVKADRVQISHSGRQGAVLALAGGPFAPGRTLEPTGSSEIEFDYVNPTFLNITGTSTADRLSWGPGGGVNLNGDDDVDVSGAFTTNIVEGRGGDDLIGPQADYSPTAAELVANGGKGNDTLTAPPVGGVLHGGAGRDRLTGGPKVDNITGGRGRDLLRGGKGRDLIRAIDGTKDRVFCGGGIDTVKADGIDKLKGCERRLFPKKAEPVGK